MVCVCQVEPHNLGVTSKYNPLAVERYSKEVVGWAEGGLTQAHLRDGYGTYIYGWLLQFLNMTWCLEWHRQKAWVSNWGAKWHMKFTPFFQAERDLPKYPHIPVEMCVLLLSSSISLQTRLVSRADSSQYTGATNQQCNSNKKQTVVWRLQEEPNAGLKRVSLPILSCASMLDGAFAWEVSLWWSRPCIGSQLGQGGAVGQNKAGAGRSWLGSVAREQPECKKAANWCVQLYSEEVLEVLLPKLVKFIWQSLSFIFSCTGCKLECKNSLQKVDYLVEY